MIELVALTGKPRSGKTTLAHELEKRGYVCINFSDMLNREGVQALSAVGVDATVDTIHQDKERYRGFLQKLGSLIGFDNDPRWVHEAIALAVGFGTLLPSRLVFDDVRTPEQWAVLRSYGFKLVRLVSSRSVDNGHPVESALAHVWADLTLDGDMGVDVLVRQVMKGYEPSLSTIVEYSKKQTLVHVS